MIYTSTILIYINRNYNVVSSFHYEIIHLNDIFTGKPALLFDEAKLDCTPTVKMGHEKRQSPNMQRMRHHKLEKLVLKKELLLPCRYSNCNM